jgi:phage terminase large subunit-like protein
LNESYTEAWIRNRSDELAVENGCWFDPDAASYVIWWIERYCRLYEGEYAGDRLVLHSIAEQPNWPVPDEWYDPSGTPNEDVLEIFRERAKWHNRLRNEGASLHWQYECIMRLFGWMRYSRKWKKPVRRFNKGGIWVCKKNGKSPTAAAITLYLCMGEGEAGQKVFIAAKDSVQAGIIWTHCEMMRQQSPELQFSTKTNNTTRRITHSDSASFIEPLSSSNSRTQNAKEGLNGCVIVDETHVVDRDFMAILEGAGISRSQPMHLEVSTAGKDTNGYGKSQFDYGAKVANGEIEDQQFFYAAYHAPQSIKLDEIDADPEKFLRMGNPAWDHLIDPEEIIATYAKKKKSRYDFANFLMYRCNVWMHAVDAWRVSGSWNRCRHEKTIEDYRDKPCIIGIDLARKYDLAGAAAAFPNKDGSIDLLVWAWTNETIVRERAPLIPDMLNWVADGHLKATEGSVIDFHVIEKDLRNLCEIFDVRGLIYDSVYAEDLTRSISEGRRVDPEDPHSKYIHEPTYVPRASMPQTFLGQAAPTVNFENDVCQEVLRHNDHPVLNWQISHATTAADSNGNIKIVKPKRGDFRTVDIVQAAIMARWGALECDEFELSSSGTYYESNDLEMW